MVQPSSNDREPADSPDFPKVGAILVAAGQGLRMGAAGNKVLLELAGATVLARALAALLPGELVREVVVVTRPEEQQAVRDLLCNPGYAPDLLRFASGGPTRGDSVRNGVKASASDLDVLLIHDAARPFVSPRVVRAVIAAAHERGAAIPVVPVRDTLKSVHSRTVLRTVARDHLCAAQTPQGFRASLLRELLNRPAGTLPTYTDEAALVEQAGKEVAAVQGDPLNIKLTGPGDLALGRAILLALGPHGPDFEVEA